MQQSILKLFFATFSSILAAGTMWGQYPLPDRFPSFYPDSLCNGEDFMYGVYGNLTINHAEHLFSDLIFPPTYGVILLIVEGDGHVLDVTIRTVDSSPKHYFDTSSVQALRTLLFPPCRLPFELTECNWQIAIPYIIQHAGRVITPTGAKKNNLPRQLEKLLGNIAEPAFTVFSPPFYWTVYPTVR